MLASGRADALAGGLSVEQLAKLDGLLVVDLSMGMTPFAWLKAMPIAPKADHIRELLDRLHLVAGRWRADRERWSRP